MTELSQRPHGEENRSPLSCPQELWYSGDQGDQAGFFGSRFIMAGALRVTGRVDVAALQGALDDVVARHEILRTVVVRDAEPPYQRIHPPCPVPLRVRDLPPAAGGSRNALAEELLIEAEQSTVNPLEPPLLRAVLSRFDDLDSVLALVVHHTACDEWSVQVIMRDLAEFYAARTTGRPPELPRAEQHREFTAWQRAGVTGPAADDAREYWRERLRGARIFAVPTDRVVPEVHTRPYSAYNFVIDPDVTAAASRLAEAVRSSTRVTLMAAFNVLIHQIAGTTDQVIDMLTTGRAEPRFHDTMGPLMNFLTFRTDIGGCASFREVVTRTRDTCVEGLSHEIPIQHIEWEMPELMEPNEEARRTNLILGIFQSPFDGVVPGIADGSYEIHKRVPSAPVSGWIPHGVAWAMHLLPSGELSGSVQFNREELDESTVADWVAGYRRILSRATSEPDREWKTL